MSNTNKKQQRRRDSQRIARDNMAKKRGEDPVKARKKRARAKDGGPGLSLSTFLAIMIILFVTVRATASTGPLLAATTDRLTKTPAVVTEITDGGFLSSKKVYPVFQYKVEGKTYTHKSLLATGTSGIREYKKGDRETVYFDKSKPSQAFSKMEITNKFKSISGYVGIVIIVLIILMLISFGNRLSRRGQEVLRTRK